MEETQEMDLITWLGRSPGGGHDNPLQYSCLDSPLDRRGWWATVHRVAQSLTRLKRLSVYANKLVNNGAI